MKKLVKIVFFSMLAMLIASCSEKKKHDDIIAPKAEKPKPQAPVRMQEYKYVDNRITVRIIRADGSVFFNKSFTKAAFDKLLNDDYRKTGILEGLVYDKMEGNHLFFAASVGHPQTDEYIPMVVTVSNLGDVGIKLDNLLDTTGEEREGDTADDEDE